MQSCEFHFYQPNKKAACAAFSCGFLPETQFTSTVIFFGFTASALGRISSSTPSL